MKPIIILLLLIQFQSSSLEKFGSAVFDNIISNNINAVMLYKINEKDLEEVKFYKSISDEKKQEFFNDILSSDDELKEKIRNAVNNFKEKKIKEKLKSSKIKILTISDDTRELNSMNLSLGHVNIIYLVGKKQESMSIEVIKINDKYKIVGDISFP